jgi:hypothetical protein
MTIAMSGGEEADLQRRLTALHQPAQLVEAVGIGTEQGAAGTGRCRCSAGSSSGQSMVEERADEAEQHEEEHDERRRSRPAGST